MIDRGAHFLIVDDNKVNRILMARSLEQQGHTVEMAENGKNGLEKLRSQAFDLVLLDIEMPEMDGFQVLEACLNDTDLRNIPIIMLALLAALALSACNTVQGVGKDLKQGGEALERAADGA